eukprot:5364891-Heterocapsa_arctica.AAC.1
MHQVQTIHHIPHGMEEIGAYKVQCVEKDGSHEMEGQLPPQEMVAASSPQGSSGSAHCQPQAGAVQRPGKSEVDMHRMRQMRRET